MVIGEDVTALAHYHAAAQATLRFFTLVAVEKLEPWVIRIRILLRGLAGVDTDDGRRGFLRGTTQTARRNFTGDRRRRLQ